jgi:hypothetical protein
MATLSDEAAYKKRADELGSVWAQGETKSAGCKRDSRRLGHIVGKHIFDYLFFSFPFLFGTNRRNLQLQRSENTKPDPQGAARPNQRTGQDQTNKLPNTRGRVTNFFFFSHPSV